MNISVRVPATSANLGPGFDCLGLALDIWNTITLAPGAADEITWREPPPSRRIDPSPLDRSALPAPADNLVLSAVESWFERTRRRRPPFHITITNVIPISRGLGSSAAAIVGGLLAANAWGGSALTDDELLELAARLDGHPDNISAALMGGLTITARDGEHILARRIAPPRQWHAALYIPAQPLPTRLARKVLPARVPRSDAIFNVSRAALLVDAFARGDAAALGPATEDRLHQQYRARLVPGMEELFDAARWAGASGTALSGAGPTLIAFCQDEKLGERARRAMEGRARELGIKGRACLVRLSPRGARVRCGTLIRRPPSYS